MHTWRPQRPSEFAFASEAELPLTFPADSNHGTIFVNQLAGLKLIVEDVAGAVNLTERYFSGLYQGQLSANGDQVWIFGPTLLFLPHRPLASGSVAVAPIPLPEL
jgi:hypothetical protein